MPIYEFLCAECGLTNEVLLLTSDDRPVCPGCGSFNMKKLLSAHAAVSASASRNLPGAGDTACCGTSPTQASCAGPGSCCGKRF